MDNVIRYRVWDGVKMWYPEEDLIKPSMGENYSGPEKWWLYMGGQVCAVGDDHNGEVITHYSDVIAMLSTGLTDKNDKEVWAGDIVSFWSIEMREATQGEVEFGNGRFYMWAPEEHIYDILLARGGEVIGNVHESSEETQG